jgi:hypothetical protein
MIERYNLLAVYAVASLLAAKKRSTHWRLVTLMAEGRPDFEEQRRKCN